MYLIYMVVGGMGLFGVLVYVFWFVFGLVFYIRVFVLINEKVFIGR